MGSNRKDVRPTCDRVVAPPAPDTYGLERIIAKEATEPPPLVTSTIEKHFYGAVTQLSLVKGLGSVLRMKGYSQNTTLAACCVCSDEINRFLDSSLQEHVACLPPFNLGGLSGFPFAGATGFGAYASHVPAGGALVLIYGPHVGVSLTGDVGKVERTGLDAPGGACGAARAAFAAVGNMPEARRAAGVPILPTDDDAETLLATDFQQHIVTHHVCACYTRAAAAEEPQAELVKQLAGRIRESLLRIVPPNLACDLAMIGGVQINTGPGTADYFLPLSFELKRAGSFALYADLLPELQAEHMAQSTTACSVAASSSSRAAELQEDARAPRRICCVRGLNAVWPAIAAPAVPVSPAAARGLLQEYFWLRSSCCVDRDAWLAILDEAFVHAQPRLPYRKQFTGSSGLSADGAPLPCGIVGDSTLFDAGTTIFDAHRVFLLGVDSYVRDMEAAREEGPRAAEATTNLDLEFGLLSEEVLDSPGDDDASAAVAVFQWRMRSRRHGVVVVGSGRARLSRGSASAAAATPYAAARGDGSGDGSAALRLQAMDIQFDVHGFVEEIAAADISAAAAAAAAVTARSC